MNNHCVVLTCTVKPKGNVAVVRNNPELRLNDYVNAIRKWHKLSTKFKFRILVLENSDSIEEIKSELPTSILESVTFYQSRNDVDSEMKGISAGEFLMLKESISVVKEMRGIDFCWKVTGRLFVTNFGRISRDGQAEMKVNRFYKPRHITDTRFFGISFPMYSQVFSQDIEFSNMNEPQSTLSLESRIFPTMEDFLTRICLELESMGRSIQSFSQIPIFEGVSASTGKKLDNWNTKVKLKVANSIRNLAVKMISGSLP